MRLKPQTYALTAVTHQRRRVFQRDLIAELLISTLFRYRNQGKFRIHAFVVMPDHTHILLTPAPDMAIERCAQLIKGGFSFAVRKDHPGEVWQEGYHAHRVTDADDLRNQTFYILKNPAKKRLNEFPWVSSNTKYATPMDVPTEIWVISQGLKPNFYCNVNARTKVRAYLRYNNNFTPPQCPSCAPDPRQRQGMT
jgi:putative transposase